MVAILFNGMEPFEQIVNILSTEGAMWNLVKIAYMVSEKETFKNYTILHMYIVQKQGQITPRGQTFDCDQKSLLLKSYIANFSQ